MDTYDVGIIGMGISGSFACLKIMKEHKNIKMIGVDVGRPPSKRRRQLDGFLGCLPNSDGKLYLNDINNVAEITGTRKAKAADYWFNDYVSKIFDLDIIKDRRPRTTVENKIKKSGFKLELNDHIQIYPKDIHNLSKQISKLIYQSKNISTSFDNEIIEIHKNKNSFTIISSEGQVECKRIIICTGRSGWRWTKSIYDSFGIVESNDIAKFGIKVEISSTVMKDFNKSNCSMIKEDLFVGPMCWNGSVIPEDHIDLAISAFRSNERRWHSDKVSFNLIGNRQFSNAGFEQTNRIGQLTFVLSNDRIMKERISTILSNKSKISIIPEYNWLSEAINEVSQFVPDIINKGYFHVPTIIPMIPKIKIGNNLMTNVDGMYCAGEAAGISGILAAALTGLVSADSACK